MSETSLINIGGTAVAGFRATRMVTLLLIAILLVGVLCQAITVWLTLDLDSTDSFFSFFSKTFVGLGISVAFSVPTASLVYRLYQKEGVVYAFGSKELLLVRVIFFISLGILILTGAAFGLGWWLGGGRYGFVGLFMGAAMVLPLGVSLIAVIISCEDFRDW